MLKFKRILDLNKTFVWLFDPFFFVGCKGRQRVKKISLRGAGRRVD